MTDRRVYTTEEFLAWLENSDKYAALRDYYDTHDTSAELAEAIENGTAVWEGEDDEAR